MKGEAAEEKLIRLLDEIQSSVDPPIEVLDQFRASYWESPREVRQSFFTLLLTRMEVARETVFPALEKVLNATPEDSLEWTSLLTTLRRALESPRMRAFRRFVNASGGLKFLLDLRADVIAVQRQAGVALGPLDEEIAYLFTSWFQYGFLFLHEITQDSSYRQIRFLKEHDMVHPMASLEEMGDRLGEDRRSFALYHRAMPEEPIVFIEAALTRCIPKSIHEILDSKEKAPEREPDTAIFYSINNAQNGLAGLGLGKLLIFQVIDRIQKARPRIQTFATLSPVSGFWRRYLNPVLSGQDDGCRLKRKDVPSMFSAGARKTILARAGAGADFPAALAETLSSPRWIEDVSLVRALEAPLTRIAYRYLTEEKDARGKPLNPVASFHLGNGAQLIPRNVHFAANRTERALADSCGFMVSYIYSSTWFSTLRRTARAMLPWEV